MHKVSSIHWELHCLFHQVLATCSNLLDKETKKDLGSFYLERDTLIPWWQLNTNPIASRITETRWSVIYGSGGSNHVKELSLIRGSHNYHVWEACHISDVK